MRNKGLTLVELGIAMAILTTIMVVVGSIFSVSTRTYQSESQRSTFLRDLNVVTDQIARDIKQSVSVQSYPPDHTLSTTKLVLNLPSLNNNDEFIYSGGTPLTDTVVYYKDGNNIYKVMYPNIASKRAASYQSGTPKIILKDNVSNLNFTYNPNINAARQVDFTITLSKVISGKTVSQTSKNTANLRNRP